MKRVVVIGSSGAGKSTFARRLAQRLESSYIELDALHWEPGWVEVPDDVFRDRVRAAAEGEAWVVDGNYAVARDVLWPRADTIVWLDYRFPVVLRRSIARTLRRSLTGEECCNGNRESIGRALSRDSIVWWVLTTYHAKRKRYGAMLPPLRASGLRVEVFRSPREADRWLAGVRSTATAARE